jgi:hypothetical protein
VPDIIWITFEDFEMSREESEIEETDPVKLEEEPGLYFTKGDIRTLLLRAKKNENLAKAVERLAGYGWDITMENAVLDSDTKEITRK